MARRALGVLSHTKQAWKRIVCFLEGAGEKDLVVDGDDGDVSLLLLLFWEE